MAIVTFPIELGGNGLVVSDDTDPTTGLRNGGYLTRFVPALQQTVAVAGFVVDQANAAASSATAAEGFASSASTSETNAADSAASAANSFLIFDNRQLGAKDADPTTDNYGGVLIVGATYFNTVAMETRVWNGTTWQTASVNGGTVNSLTVTGAFEYQDTFTGGAGVMNIGNGQVYKDADGNVGINTVTPDSKFQSYAGTGLSVSHARFGDTPTGYWDFVSGGNPVTRLLLTGFNSAGVEQVRFDPASVSFLLGGNFLLGTKSENGIVSTGGFVLSSGNGGSLYVQRDIVPGENGLGSINFRARVDATNFVIGTSISALTAAAWTTTSTPCNLLFSTTPSGSTSQINRARFTSVGNFRPEADNAYSLGESAFRWSVVYAATGTINTSDERAKLDFQPALGLDFITSLNPVSYRYKVGKTVIDQVEDGVEEVPPVFDEEGKEIEPATTRIKYKSVERVVEGTRRHHGLKAQEVKAVLDQFGIDFAGWVLDDPSDPGSGQGLRYDQFVAPLINAVKQQQVMFEQNQSAVTDLIQRVSNLEAAAA